jgi:hypothetical protein
MADRRGESYADGYLDDEIQAFVVSRYCKGMKDAKIREALAKWLGKDPSELEEHIVRAEVLQARKNGRLRYEADREEGLANALENSLRALPIHATSPKPLISPKIEVVATTEPLDIARIGADRLRVEIISHFRESGREVLNIGFAGGLTPSLTAKALSELLTTPDVWPDDVYSATPKRKIYFHSIVGSINSSKPEVDPNSFLIYLASSNRDLRHFPFELRFFRMPAPGVVTWDEYRRLTGKDGRGGFGLINDMIQRKDNIDIIVASCGHWKENCSSVYDYLQNVCESNDKLRGPWLDTIAGLNARKILGDIMWWPIGASGPFRMGHTLRVFSLLDLFDLVKRVTPRQGRDGMMKPRGKVVLLVGPCSGSECRESKGKLLSGIMKMPRLPMTHLIVDSRSARDCIDHLTVTM